jgi:hypothetical protein
MAKKPEFEAGDLELLETVLNVVPNLRAVAHAAKHVRKHCKYPIANPDELLRVFEAKPDIDLGGRRVARKGTEVFVPAAFYPIESEQDLVGKLLIAFQIGDHFHQNENTRQMAEGDEDMETTVIPGPVFHHVTKKALLRAQRKGA